MADGKDISTKLKELLLADETVYNIIGGQIWFGDFHPVGNVKPQIVYKITDEGSEPRIPAKRALLEFWIWVKTDDTTPRATIVLLKNAINTLINRNVDESFNEISVRWDEGLRIVECLKLFGGEEYDEKYKCYYGNYTYRIVMSENESFNPASAGDKAWV